MNSNEFIKECNKSWYARLELKDLLHAIHRMHIATTIDELKYWTYQAETYRHGLFAYFIGLSINGEKNYEIQSYCYKLIGIIANKHRRMIDKILK